MTKEPDGKPGLGDLLAPASDFLNKQSSRPEPQASMTLLEAEDLLSRIATAHGEDAGPVIDELRRKTPLAQLCKKILNVADNRRLSRDEIALHTVRFLSAQGLRGKAVYEAAAELLNSETDAAGRRHRNITAGSVESESKRARRALRRQMSPLAQLFAPFLDRLGKNKG